MKNNIDWTENQKRAIYTKGNVLVSASAGSGKTAVLVERIFTYIDLGIRLDKMLVIVYNNQAAEELRQRIGKKLLEKIASDGAEKYQTAYDSLPFCKISTLHAFCLSQVRENFDFFDIEPSFDIASEDEIQTFYKRAFRKVVESFYGEKDVLFDEMVDMFGTKRNDEGLFNAVLKLYEIKEIMPDGDDFLKSLSADFCDFERNKYFDEIKKDVLRIICSVEEELDKIMYLLRKDGNEKYYDYFTAIKNVLLALKKADCVTDTANAFQAFFGMDNFPRASKQCDVVIAKEAKDLRDRIKNALKKYEKTFADLSALKFSFSQNKSITEKLVEATVKFDAELSAIKKKAIKITFNDLEHYMLKLLESERADSIKAGVELVYVDEYQDINRLQESLILKLAPVDACFMVGDVKQSIYGFRLADPTIFIDKLMRYKSGEGNAIELNSNFRSKNKILSFVNDLFSAIMTKENSNFDYAETSKFILSDEPDNEQRVEIHAFENTEKTVVNFSGLYDISKHAEPDEQITDSFMEGKFIADKIKEFIRTGKAKNYGQFAVLFDRRSHCAQTVCETLIAEGIPIAGNDFIRSDFKPEWELILLLKAIDNPHNAIPFAGFLLSYFGGYTKDELYDLGSGDLFVNLVERAKGTDDFAAKAKNTLNLIENYRVEAAMGTVSDFLHKVVFETGYASFVRAGNDVLPQIEKFIGELTGKEANSSIARFLEYYNADNAETSAAHKRDTKVSVMTMHASKGLEFDFVFIANCSETFRKADKRYDLLIDQDGFIGIKGFDSENKTKLPSLSLEGTINVLNRKEFAERIRLFYVAATRAKEYMFITGRSVKADENSFMGLVLKHCLSVQFHKADLSRSESEIKMPTFGTPDKSLMDKLNELSEFDYPYAVATETSAKQSVSSLSEDNYDGTVTPFKEENIEKGIAYHKVMQNIDFDSLDVEGDVADMVRLGILSEKEAESIDVKEIENCLRSDLIKSSIGKKSEREKPFTMLLPKGDDAVLVQGVIDLIIYDDDGIVIVDYKNSARSDKALIDTYFTQLDLYRQAVESANIGKVKECDIYSFPKGKAVTVYSNVKK
ncbi:MAG: UvrD-helicase domain-containing protein [Christensenellales bacterium]